MGEMDFVGQLFVISPALGVLLFWILDQRGTIKEQRADIKDLTKSVLDLTTASMETSAVQAKATQAAADGFEQALGALVEERRKGTAA